MANEFVIAAKEIFKYKELLKEIVTVSMNVPDVYLERLYPIYTEFVDLVNSFTPFSMAELQEFIDSGLVRYAGSPFFPVLAGLYVDALLNKLFESEDILQLDLDKFCSQVVSDATAQAQIPIMPEMNSENSDEEGEESGGFSLDFLGYLMPAEKTLEIIGSVGDYCGALMNAHCKLIVHGQNGKHFGFERDPTSDIKLY
jgi:hypothetical protein